MQSTVAQRRLLPLWALLALAFGLAPLVSVTLNPVFASANDWLVASLGIEARSNIHLSRLILRVALPTLVLFLVLTFTPLRSWIVLPRLGAGLLLIENAFSLLHVVNQISLYVLNGNGAFRQLVKGPMDLVAIGCLLASLGLTTWATARHRSTSCRLLFERVSESWLRPV